MEKSREVEPVPAERDDVRVAGSRCPYCLEDVALESADVCCDCLAWHHGDCWTEGTRCGACGSVHVLRRPVLEGRPEDHVDRCLTAGCLQRGPFFHCATHGAADRRFARNLGVSFILCGLVCLLGLGWVAVDQNAGLATVVLVVGAALFSLFGGVGGALLHRVRRLPPLPAPLEKTASG